jgi:UDP-N-acetylglucosamine--N-acetylmuramyl-(pentapeptide) pyrophosphoryl-undecaprenol N-acetylglucosamine transferase
MRVIFAGGGTLGPVTPLLAVARALRRLNPAVQIVWIGTPGGPERALVEAEGYRFLTIAVAKFPRYPSIYWLTFPWAAWGAWARAKRLVRELRPTIVVSAGGFTAVPVCRAAKRKGIPCLTHQLDVRPGLANRIIAKSGAIVTTSFTYTEPPFGRVKTECLPTPTRFSGKRLPSKHDALRSFGLLEDRPTVLVMGGGTGAATLNAFVDRVREPWTEKWNIIHLTGQGKEGSRYEKRDQHYAVMDFAGDKMLDAYAAADVVVCRAGMGTLSELAALKKAAVLVPISDSHQEDNTRWLEDRKAVRVVAQTDARFDQRIEHELTELFASEGERHALGERLFDVLPTDDGTALAEKVLDITAQRVRNGAAS